MGRVRGRGRGVRYSSPTPVASSGALPAVKNQRVGTPEVLIYLPAGGAVAWPNCPKLLLPAEVPGKKKKGNENSVKQGK